MMIGRRNLLLGMLAVSVASSAKAESEIISRKDLLQKNIIIQDFDIYERCYFFDCCISFETKKASIIGCYFDGCTFAQPLREWMDMMHECSVTRSSVGFECKVPIS